MASPLPRAAAAATAWPTEDLESVPACPVCEGTSRRPWHDGLTDEVFRTAPGTWALARCTDCGAAWLDPRPTRGSILRAYANYYTHTSVDGAGEREGWIRTALRQGYLRARWGYDVRPAWTLGRFTIGKRDAEAIDLSVRHLPRPKARARLLDVGCGNGAFLVRMRALGWDVHGLEPDPSAAKTAAAAGIEVVVGTLDDARWPDRSFDVVTLSSVIEHLHDPHQALDACFRLLAPGGVLHLLTPNVDALGAVRFGAHWRGLEAPRHLVLFGRASLTRMLTAHGFTDVTFPARFVAELFWVMSGALERGITHDEARKLPRRERHALRRERHALRREGRDADRRAEREPDRAEELIALARKPAK